mgnify:CR=1 FL=1
MNNANDPNDEKLAREVERQLEKIFSSFEREISLILFTDPARNPAFTDLTRQFIRLVRRKTHKITLKEYSLDHPLAREYGITQAPALLFSPEEYKIRWLGAPAAEEGRTFVEALVMLGTGQVKLSGPAGSILDKIDSPRHIKVFVSPTCPYCPQQAVNALKAAIAAPGKISLEIIDIQMNPELAEKYSAHSVPQVWANEKLIALGGQPQELFMASLQKLEQQTIFIPESDAEEIEADLVIVGGGPAGLTAGIYASRSGLDTVVVEKGALGGQVATTPIVENYPGLKQVSGKTLVEIMVSHALEYVNIFPDEEVMDIKNGETFTVLTNRRKYHARAVLLATGANYKKLDVPGEMRLAGRGVSYCSTCDGALFKGKKAMMVGGGNSAVTEALHLANIGVKVTLVHRRDKLRAQEHLVENLRTAGIPVMYNKIVREISGRQKVESVILVDTVTGEAEEMETSAVFIAIGYLPTIELARKIGVEITPDGFIRRDARHRTNIAGIYSAGDVEGGYKQIVTASGQGAEAAMSIFEDLVNPYWIKEKEKTSG